eukprot:m.293134 g.293134  ORF g.293134 m.293134 type:complete len:292 (-) comp20015_c0_seq7:1329-2204(-)
MEWMKGFVRRHKWKLAILGTGAATVYAAKAYLDGKIRELEQQALEEHISRARRQTHFESNEESCNITVESLLPSLYQALEESLGAVELLAKLRVAPSPDDKPNAKAILWQALSIKVLTGAIAASYSLGLLVVFLRVQLNVLGGYLYISTMPENAAKDPISSEVQRKFLGLVEHLQTQGIQDLIAWIEPVVDEVFQQSKLVGSLMRHSAFPNVVVVNAEEGRSTDGIFDVAQMCRCYALDEHSYGNFNPCDCERRVKMSVSFVLRDFPENLGKQFFLLHTLSLSLFRIWSHI